MINFRYTILRKMGEGGGGEVFLVEDTLRRNHKCALKVLSQSEEATQFRNEMTALANLQHPNLIRVFDVGLIRSCEHAALSGRRYLTMELVDGPDIMEWYCGVEANKNRGYLLAQVFLQAAGALFHVHREGIVHSDVKPGNLLLVCGEDEGAPPILKLTDFGLSTRIEASLGISLRGTLEYTAPELLRGDPGDHRVDLYSLGASFFHVIENRCPFEAATPVDLIKEVLNKPAVFSQASVESVPDLCQIVSTLLAKDPADRFRSAADAAGAVLEKLPALASAFVVSARPRFVGRHAERGTIASAILALNKNPAVPKTPLCIVVSGHDGMGKTALLAEMVKVARGQDLPVFETESLSQAVPFRVASTILAQLCAAVASFSESGQRLVGKFSSVQTSLLGNGGIRAGERIEEWEREKEQYIALTSRFIIESAAHFPFVVVIDDLMMADEESRMVFENVALHATPGRILLLMAGESSIASEHVLALPLTELTETDVVGMVGSVVGSTALGKAIGERLFKLYGGVPSVLVEALRAVEEKLPSGTTGEVYEFIEHLSEHLPATIDQFMVNRYRELSREKQMCLAAVSCFQGTAARPVLERVLPFHPSRFHEHLDVLETEGYLQSAGHGEQISIRQLKMKEAIYVLVGADRMRLHAAIATTYEKVNTRPSFDDLEEIGFQFHEGDERVRGTDYIERAADEGISISAFKRAIDLYRKALEWTAQLADEKRSRRLKRKLANALFRGGEYKSAIDVATELLANSVASQDNVFHLHEVIGLAQSRLGDYESSKQNILTALASMSDESEKLRLRQELVGIDIALGKFRDAETSSLDQLKSAGRFEDTRLMGAVLTDLGIATFFQDRFDDAANYFAKSLEIYKSLRDRYRVVDAMINIGNVMSSKGDLQDAIEYWGNAREISREYGSLHQQSQIENNMGIAYYKLRQYTHAKALYTSARDISTRLGSKAGIAYALTNLGEVSLAEGEYENALMFWTEGLVLYKEMEDAHGVVETLLQLGQVWLTIGHAKSVAFIAEARETIDAKDLNTFRGRVKFLEGVQSLKQGNVKLAAGFFSEALAVFTTAGEKEQAAMSRIRVVESSYRLGQQEDTAALIPELFEALEVTESPQIVSEGYYLLGTIARESRTWLADKPLSLFKKGFEAIAREPVTELTWRIAFALAREYRERGQENKAGEYMSQARLVLQYFLSHLKSVELRKQYLACEDRAKTLATIESWTRT